MLLDPAQATNSPPITYIQTYMTMNNRGLTLTQNLCPDFPFVAYT